ncbi:hypothetical protein Tco_0315739 [Tanacetum coccineum]
MRRMKVQGGGGQFYPGWKTRAYALQLRKLITGWVDELCPPNKRYDLIDANKKVDLENVQCPSESKILMNIITNHPLRFSIAASASVPWIYMAQFWHTLKKDGSKHRLKFLLDRKELTLTLDDFRTIFHLPQANDNNNALFVPPPSFSDMVPFYKQVLGFSMELKKVSNFKKSGLLQPWQTLRKMYSNAAYNTFTALESSHRNHMTLYAPSHLTLHEDNLKQVSQNDHSESFSINVDSICIPNINLLRGQQQKKAEEIFTRNSSSKFADKRFEEQEARENVALVAEHLAAEEIVKLVEESENVDDSLPTRHDDTSIPDTRRRAKGKNVEESRISPTRSLRNLSTLVSPDIEKL